MTAHARNHKTTPLSEVEAEIGRTRYGPLTLDPSRELATELTSVVAGLADQEQLPYLSAAASAVAEAQLQSFPENLFWDFDFFVASIHRDASASSDYLGYLDEVAQITVQLMRLYGQQSVIRFRYVHDFMYGFDWARWVSRDPASRGHVEPFGLEFLRQTQSRGRDILALIEADDEVYPSLAQGVSRNPFPFAREPEHELPLYRLLAERGQVPVEAWRSDVQPDASRDFDALRDAAAASLGLGR